MANADASAQMQARSVQIDGDTWAVGLSLPSEHTALKNRANTCFHFVLDNSGSMGDNTNVARNCFSELVSVATGPCSLTVFSHCVATLSDAIDSPDAMRQIALPGQGQTNITEGVKAAVNVITLFENAEGNAGTTHHVMILLSDGDHNSGPRPESALPQLGNKLKQTLPSLRLSVVVVGVTGSSNTSLAMLLKDNLETVRVPSLEPIYFARDSSAMRSVLGEMRDGLSEMRGGLLHIALDSMDVDGASGGGFVRVVGDDLVKDMHVLATEREMTLLVCKEEPKSLLVDGTSVACDPLDFDSDLAAAALDGLLAGLRQRRVASGAGSVVAALGMVEAWASAFEARLQERMSIEAKEATERALESAKELRKQLKEIQALGNASSSGQAAFLSRGRYGAQASAGVSTGKTPVRRRAGAKSAKVVKKPKWEKGSIAKGKTAKLSVLQGKSLKTGGKLKKDDLMKSKSGKVVSKKMHARGKATYEVRLKPWVEACRAAKAALGLTGFVVMRKGTPVYEKAKDIYAAQKK